MLTTLSKCLSLLKLWAFTWKKPHTVKINWFWFEKATENQKRKPFRGTACKLKDTHVLCLLLGTTLVLSLFFVTRQGKLHYIWVMGWTYLSGFLQSAFKCNIKPGTILKRLNFRMGAHYLYNIILQSKGLVNIL